MKGGYLNIEIIQKEIYFRQNPYFIAKETRNQNNILTKNLATNQMRIFDENFQSCFFATKFFDVNLIARLDRAAHFQDPAARFSNSCHTLNWPCRPIGAMASTFISHADDQGSIPSGDQSLT